MPERHEEEREAEEASDGGLLTSKDVDEVLRRMVERAEAELPGAHAVSVTVPRGATHCTPAASKPEIFDVDAAQYRSGGPCVDAATKGVTIYIPDLAADERWRGFVDKAISVGLTSVFSVPLRAGDRLIGSMNFYSSKRDAFDPDQRESAARFADRTVVTISNAYEFGRVSKENDDLKVALDSREIIGTAKGILMEREGISKEEAFQMLIAASQRMNRKLREIAEEIVRQADSDHK